MTAQSLGSGNGLSTSNRNAFPVGHGTFTPLALRNEGSLEGARPFLPACADQLPIP
jgi:hypothetical protein